MRSRSLKDIVTNILISVLSRIENDYNSVKICKELHLVIVMLFQVTLGPRPCLNLSSHRRIETLL